MATAVSVLGLKEALKKWNPKLKIESSAQGDSVIATAKYIDVTADELKDLAALMDGWTVSFGRSGANFRMIFW